MKFALSVSLFCAGAGSLEAMVASKMCFPPIPSDICMEKLTAVLSPGFMVVEPRTAWAFQQPSSRFTDNGPSLSGPAPVFLMTKAWSTFWPTGTSPKSKLVSSSCMRPPVSG